MRNSFPLVVSLVVVVVGLGCDGSEESSDLTAYFAATPYANAACNVVDQRLAGERQMRLYVNGGVSPKPVTQGLASYYHRHALSFVTDTQPQATTMAYAINTDDDALNAALAA